MGSAVLLLAACGSPEGVGALEAEAGPRDALPAYMEEAGLDLASSRLLAESGEVAFYAAKPAADGAASAACIVIDARDGESSWVAGCSEKAPVAAGRGGVQAMLVPDGFDPTRPAGGGLDPNVNLLEQGWEELHENLLVKGL
ncbi:hypothetical protein D477_014341 [Arthrobacter crystallopoietes BAB-32]|uniref:Uncharacterized protein n=1 Tax=Arthrobacter crystallopoietes BAB-32 TaxID=1246476 RepID=N1UWU1_9MICC|nr:hypothetical protein D477_014341 [Arthrobacter crystallopoietes BAB-32]